MIEIKQGLDRISGGNPAIGLGVAVIEGVGIFGAIPTIGGSLGQDWSYPTIGAGIGEGIYNMVNPNPLGQMEYTAADFGGSYIASAFPDEYPHW